MFLCVGVCATVPLALFLYLGRLDCPYLSLTLELLESNHLLTSQSLPCSLSNSSQSLVFHCFKHDSHGPVQRFYQQARFWPMRLEQRHNRDSGKLKGEHNRVRLVQRWLLSSSSKWQADKNSQAYRDTETVPKERCKHIQVACNRWDIQTAWLSQMGYFGKWMWVWMKF